jgi:hypothetical protein
VRAGGGFAHEQLDEPTIRHLVAHGRKWVANSASGRPRPRQRLPAPAHGSAVSANARCAGCRVNLGGLPGGQCVPAEKLGLVPRNLLGMAGIVAMPLFTAA